MNPECPVCGELLQLDRIGEVVWDYAPVPPPSMRRYLTSAGAHAMIWECFGCGEFWSPASPVGSFG